nr:hypothetical protein [uncultured Cellulosilyticum sp.]
MPKHAILKDQEYTLPFNIDNISSGMTIINNTAYFIPPVSSDFSGTASLYLIQSFAPHTFHMLDEESLLDTLGTIIPIYNVELDTHDTSILGLENINDYLVLILMTHNQLVFQTINPITGKLISERTTGDLPPLSTNYTYIPFISDNSLSLILNLDSIHSLLIGTSINTNGQITAISSVISTDNENLNYHSSFLSFVNNKLFLFESVWDSETDNSLLLSVYGGTKLIYKGKFITNSFFNSLSVKEAS